MVVIGTRLVLLLVPTIILLAVLLRFGVAEAAFKPALPVLVVLLFLSAFAMILSNLLLVGKATRYNVEAGGRIDITRTWTFIECFVRDITNFRQW